MYVFPVNDEMLFGTLMFSLKLCYYVLNKLYKGNNDSLDFGKMRYTS